MLPDGEAVRVLWPDRTVTLMSQSVSAVGLFVFKWCG